MTMSPSSEQVTASALIPTCRHGHRPPRGRRHRRTARPSRPLPPSRRLHASSRPFVDPPTVTGRCCPLSPARQQLPYLPFAGCHHQHVLDAAARVHLDGAVPPRRGHHGAPGVHRDGSTPSTTADECTCGRASRPRRHCGPASRAGTPGTSCGHRPARWCASSPRASSPLPTHPVRSGSPMRAASCCGPRAPASPPCASRSARPSRAPRRWPGTGCGSPSPAERRGPRWVVP